MPALASRLPAIFLRRHSGKLFDPLELFKAFLPDSVLANWARLTNAYATTQYQSREERRRAAILMGKPVYKPSDCEREVDVTCVPTFPVDCTPAEIKVFLAILFTQGLDPRHWRSPSVTDIVDLGTPFVRRAMSRDRWLWIRRHFQVSALHTDAQAVNDPFVKFRELLEYVRVVCLFNATAGPTSAIDESMIRFSGRSSLKTVIKSKPIPVGFKAFVRCDSKTGYTHSVVMSHEALERVTSPSPTAPCTAPRPLKIPELMAALTFVCSAACDRCGS